MKKIVLILFVLMPSLTMAQDWLPMLRKVFECAPAWSDNGGYSRDAAGYEPRTYCGPGGYSGKYGFFRIGNMDMAIHIYYNSEIEYLPGTMFYVGESLTCWEPSFDGRCYSASGKLLYEGKFNEDGSGDNWRHPLSSYPTPYSSNKRFQAIWDGPNMYLGETLNGVKHGWGLYIWANGDCLFGEWKNGKKCGYGMRKFSKTCSCISQDNWPSVNYLPGNME